MLGDALRIAASAGSGFQYRRVAVGHAGEIIEATARQFAEPLETRAQVFEQVCRQIDRQQPLELRIT